MSSARISYGGAARPRYPERRVRRRRWTAAQRLGAGAALVVGALVGAACGSAEPTPAAEADDAPTQVILVGDSITEGPYYRPFLLRSLADLDCDLDFVGGRTGLVALDGSPVVDGLDVDHQAIGGAGSTEILAALRAAVTPLEPDIALVYAGTNDVFLGIERDRTIDNIRAIVTTLRSANPQVDVYLAELMPIAAVELRTASLNSRIGTAAEGLDRPGSAVVAVDMNSGVSAADDLVDGVHPTDAQSEVLAQRWIAAIQPSLDRACST